MRHAKSKLLKKMLSPDGRARIKGSRAEAVVVRALNSLTLPWLRRARRATPREDRSGIDVIVTTRDMGDLLLQVKSSLYGARKWARRNDVRLARKRIAIVIVTPHDDKPTVLGRALAALVMLREARALRQLPP